MSNPSRDLLSRDYQLGSRSLAILGGGIAGLAAGFYARRADIPFVLCEASPQVGGLCVTYREGEFSFDSGAHRLHDKDPQTTRDAMDLLGDALRPVNVPSQIFDHGRLVNFPFGVRDMIRHLGPLAVVRAGVDLLTARLGSHSPETFSGVTIRRYGRTIANRFLINYTEKLWGRPCEFLVAELSGGRLRGLDLRQVIRGSMGMGKNIDHLEGSFYYPREGIGMLTSALEKSCGQAITTNACVVQLGRNDRRITSVVTAQEHVVSPAAVVSTIPLDTLVRILDPPAPAEILRAASTLTYRDVVVVAVFLDAPSVTHAATVYFPDRRFPFTRIVEPRNRSHAMSPPGATSLLAEIPCEPHGEIWNTSDDTMSAMVIDGLHRVGWIKPDHVLGTAVRRLSHAYPVITLEARDAVNRISGYLRTIENLHLAGRNGRFTYAWIHDLMRHARATIHHLASTEKSLK